MAPDEVDVSWSKDGDNITVRCANKTFTHEPGFLSYAIRSFYPTSADGLQGCPTEAAGRAGLRLYLLN